MRARRGVEEEGWGCVEGRDRGRGRAEDADPPQIHSCQAVVSPERTNMSEAT